MTTWIFFPGHATICVSNSLDVAYQVQLKDRLLLRGCSSCLFRFVLSKVRATWSFEERPDVGGVVPRHGLTSTINKSVRLQ